MAAAQIEEQDFAPIPKKETKIESLADLYDDPELFDALLLNRHTKATHKIHKAVVASGAKYFYYAFKAIPAELAKKEENIPPVIEIPVPL